MPLSRKDVATENRFRWLAVVLLMVLAGPVFGQHVDIWVHTDGTRLMTGAFDFDAGTPIENNLQVFGYEFQEIPEDPYFIQDPGFAAGPNDTPGGSGLPGFPSPNQSRIGFNIRSGLKFWNGEAFTSEFPNAESLTLVIGTQSRVATGETGFITGVNFATVFNHASDNNKDGAIHAHLSSWLAGENETLPTDGIYLLELELTTNVANIGPSLPFFIVFNNGLSEPEHDTAMEWVQSNRVPEPSSLSIVVLGTVFLLRRRSR